MTNVEFIDAIAGYVIKYAKDYGILVHSPIIAQAILESGWGKSRLSAEYHNYFGMKCGSKWTGASVNMATKEEYKAGVLTDIKANFRAYASMEDGVKGYFEFIQLARYSNLKGITDPREYLELIKADGYATSSTYVNDNYKIITQYGLTKYDTMEGVNIMTANEKRIKVRDAYKPFIGRNNYSQDWRDFCLAPRSNGKYYSDCSSSVSYAYKAAGFGFGILNTVGMYSKKEFYEVPVVISKGQIQNPEVLRIGDMLLYAGTNTGRASYNYVGHVEMIGEISGTKYTLYGHGSGYPKKTDMVEKNKSRYNSKTTTKLGHKGLIKVVRWIMDDTTEETPIEEPKALKVKVNSGTWNIRKGAGTEFASIGIIKGGTIMDVIEKMSNGWYCVKSANITGYISGKAVTEV